MVRSKKVRASRRRTKSLPERRRLAPKTAREVCATTRPAPRPAIAQDLDRLIPPYERPDADSLQKAILELRRIEACILPGYAVTCSCLIFGMVKRGLTVAEGMWALYEQIASGRYSAMLLDELPDDARLVWEQDLPAGLELAEGTLHIDETWSILTVTLPRNAGKPGEAGEASRLDTGLTDGLMHSSPSQHSPAVTVEWSKPVGYKKLRNDFNLPSQATLKRRLIRGTTPQEGKLRYQSPNDKARIIQVAIEDLPASLRDNYQPCLGHQPSTTIPSRAPRSRTGTLLLPKQACSHLHLCPFNFSQNGRI